MSSKNTSEQNRAEQAILQIECNPSLKEDMKSCLIKAGFSSISDCIRTLTRDFVAGRFHYRGGILQSQGQIT